MVLVITGVIKLTMKANAVIECDQHPLVMIYCSSLWHRAPQLHLFTFTSFVHLLRLLLCISASIATLLIKFIS